MTFLFCRIAPYSRYEQFCCGSPFKSKTTKTKESVHPSVFLCLSRTGSWRQQTQQGSPDTPISGHLHQLTRFPNHLNWLFSRRRSSGSTSSSRRMSELLTLSLRLSPATLRRKLISGACICDLVNIWYMGQFCKPKMLHNSESEWYTLVKPIWPLWVN